LTVVVNGEQKQVEDACTVAALVSTLELRPERLAVEVNKKIIRKAEWAGTVLTDGDRIEVVHFVGGG
jgi:thiamine biosynthesis protein ThiS